MLWSAFSEKDSRLRLWNVEVLSTWCIYYVWNNNFTVISLQRKTKNEKRKSIGSYMETVEKKSSERSTFHHVKLTEQLSRRHIFISSTVEKLLSRNRLIRCTKHYREYYRVVIWNITHLYNTVSWECKFDTENIHGYKCIIRNGPMAEHLRGK